MTRKRNTDKNEEIKFKPVDRIADVEMKLTLSVALSSDDELDDSIDSEHKLGNWNDELERRVLSIFSQFNFFNF